MRYDPIQRLRKYQPISQHLIAAGYSVDIPLDIDFDDVMLVRNPQAKNQSVLVYRRDRGWFLSDRLRPWGQVYEAKGVEDLVGVIKRCLISFPAKEADAKAMGLQAVLAASWDQDERRESLERLASFGWRELSEEEVRELGERYQQLFWRNDQLVLPHPSVAWKLKYEFGSEDLDFEKLETEFTNILRPAPPGRSPCTGSGRP